MSEKKRTKNRPLSLLAKLRPDQRTYSDFKTFIMIVNLATITLMCGLL